MQIQLQEEHSAAHSLEGKTLKTGWRVIEKVKAKPGSTGSHFSVCYKVEKDGEKGFLKVINILKFMQGDENFDMPKIMASVLETFNFEKELLNRCREKNLSKVSRLLEAGQENFTGFFISAVYYMIFERADSDVREILNFSQNVDTAWKLRSIHNVAVGLRQLHGIEISHQDLKPSNVFIFQNTISKLGDLGRSLCKSLDGPHSKSTFPGDWRYAPPEVMLLYTIPDWNNRVFAIDCYLLGSLTVFYFTGLTMTGLLQQNLNQTIDWNQYYGKFKSAVPFLTQAFEESLKSFSERLGNYEDKLILIDQVRMLCYPDPDLRGHSININLPGNNYNLERFITKFDVLASRAELKLSK